MKKFMGVLVLVLVAVFVIGCGNNEATPTTRPGTRIAKPSPVSDSSDLEDLKVKVARLEAKVSDLEITVAVNKGSSDGISSRVYQLEDKAYVQEMGGPAGIIKILHKELDAVEAGKNPYGSFTDYFAPLASSAKEYGADPNELNKVLDRAVRLAKQGKFISTYAAENPDLFFERIEGLRPDKQS